MDRGLAEAVDRFASVVGDALTDAASGTTVATSALHRDAVVEAFNLSCALVDADGRQTDDELWALVAAFARFDLLPGAATPQDLRATDLITRNRNFLDTPSELFVTLAQIDARKGTTLARRYYDEAMALSHTVASIDQYPSDHELKAIVEFRQLLLTALPTGQPAAATQKPTPTGADPLPEPEPPEPIEDLLSELDGLIGLDAVKEEVRLLSALLRVQ